MLLDRYDRNGRRTRTWFHSFGRAFVRWMNLDLAKLHRRVSW